MRVVKDYGMFEHMIYKQNLKDIYKDLQNCKKNYQLSKQMSSNHLEILTKTKYMYIKYQNLHV